MSTEMTVTKTSEKVYPMRVRKGTFNALKVMADERKRTLPQTLEETIQRGLKRDEQLQALLGSAYAIVASEAKRMDVPFEVSLYYLVHVAKGRNAALVSDNGRPKQGRRKALQLAKEMGYFDPPLVLPEGK